jgi:CopG family nickel-responsive transcriptional regulator
MKENMLKRMSFSIEEELFDQLESLLAQTGYDNRSEFIRDMIRKQLTRKQCSDSGKVIGTISVLCNLKSSGIEAKLMQIVDQACTETLGMSRFALDENFSTTMISVTGIGSDIRELVNSIRRLKGVIQAEFVITAVSVSL